MKRVDRQRRQELFGRLAPASGRRCCLRTVGAQGRTGQQDAVDLFELPRPTNAAIRMAARSLVLLSLALVLLFAPRTLARENVRVACKPRTFHVVPGQRVRLELTVRARTAAAIRLHVPADPRLKLRAVEKHPVQRTPAGVIVHKRVIIWQALEPGTVKVNAISVETRSWKQPFPEVTITVSDPGT